MIDITAISGSLIAGFATGMGALPIYFRKQYSPKTLNVGLGFSAGIMLVAAFLSLIITGIEEARTYYPQSIALPMVLLGILWAIFLLLESTKFSHTNIYLKIMMSLTNNLSVE